MSQQPLKFSIYKRDVPQSHIWTLIKALNSIREVWESNPHSAATLWPDAVIETAADEILNKLANICLVEEDEDEA